MITLEELIICTKLLQTFTALPRHLQFTYSEFKHFAADTHAQKDITRQ
jgi:hypothetical protein